MQRSFLASTVSIVGVLAACLPASAQRPGGEYGAVVLESSPPEGWAISLPLSGTGAAPPPVRVRAGQATSIPLPDTGYALVCGGADDCATVCSVLRDGEDLALLRLVNGSRVRGRVLLDRSPVADGRVHLQLTNVESRRPFSLPLSRSKTDAISTSVATGPDGSFEFAHVAPGTYAAEVHFRDGRIYQGDTFVVPDGDDRGLASMQLPLIQVPEGLRTAIRVHDRDGRPIAGAGVGLLQQDGTRITFAAETKTDADGLASVSGLDFGLPVHLTCSAPGFARVQEKLSAPPASHDCLLVRNGNVSGRVVSMDGEPLSATIRLEGSDKSTTASGDGSFRLSGVPAGAAQLRATAPGHRAGIHAVLVDERLDTDAGTIELAEADALRGVVIDAESRSPIEGATVAVQDPAQSVLTNHDGQFTVKVDLVQGARLEVTAAGYAIGTHDVAAVLAERDGAHEEQEIRLERAGELEVTVWNDDGDAPCADCTVSIANQYVMRSGRTDGSGIARFADLAPGQYQVGREYVSAGAAIVHVSSGKSMRIVLVKPRETTRVQLGSRKRVVDIALAPQPPPDCRLSGLSRGTAVLAERDGGQGSFHLPTQPGETYRLQLSCGSMGVRIGTLPAELDGTLFPIRLGESSVVGIVAMEGDRPGGYGITLRSAADGSVIAWASPQPDGRFAVPYLVPGTYTLEIGTSPSRVMVVVTGSATDVGRVR
jgi:hypothetical protein